jgi:AcrR family transcriptional regulator
MLLLKLKEQERERRREIILRAAQELFSKRGLSGVNMRDIAHKAGVSVGFIYRYFPARADIFVELFEAGAATVFERMKADVEAQDPLPLRRLARTYLDFLHENRMFFEMMGHFMLEGRLSDRALRRVNDGLRRIMDGLEVAFENETRGKESRMLAHSFFAALNGIMISFAKYPGRSPKEIKKRTLLLGESIAERFERGAHT